VQRRDESNANTVPPVDSLGDIVSAQTNHGFFVLNETTGGFLVHNRAAGVLA